MFSSAMQEKCRILVEVPVELANNVEIYLVGWSWLNWMNRFEFQRSLQSISHMSCNRSIDNLAVSILEHHDIPAKVRFLKLQEYQLKAYTRFFFFKWQLINSTWTEIFRNLHLQKSLGETRFSTTSSTVHARLLTWLLKRSESNICIEIKFRKWLLLIVILIMIWNSRTNHVYSDLFISK